MYKRINYVLIIIFLLTLGINSCSVGNKLKYSERTLLLLDSTVVADSAILKLVEPYKNEIDRTMNAVLVVSAQALVKSQPEGLLGNIVADLTLETCNYNYQPEDGELADICILNNGGLRTSLPKGEITRGKVFELMPFENEIVVLTLSGENTLNLLKYIAKVGGIPVAGFKMGIKDDEPKDIIIGGKPFDINRNYKVVTSDYLASGGDKMYFFNNPINYEYVNKMLRDAIIEYFTAIGEKNEELVVKFDDRIYYATE